MALRGGLAATSMPTFTDDVDTYVITAGVITLVDTDIATSATTMEGYFSDKDNDPLTCNFNVTRGDSVNVNPSSTEQQAIVIDTDTAVAATPGVRRVPPRTGITTVAVTCTDTFESATDTLTMEVDFQGSISN